MTRLLTLSAVALGIAPTAVLAQAPAVTFPAGFALVSPQRAFQGSIEGKAALARLAALREERTQSLADMHRELQTLESRLTDGLTGAARTQAEQETNEFRLDIQRFIEDAQAELADLQQDAEAKFLDRFVPIVGEIALERNLRLVFNEDAGLIAWANPALDITARVVQRLDQSTGR